MPEVTEFSRMLETYLQVELCPSTVKVGIPENGLDAAFVDPLLSGILEDDQKSITKGK